MSPRILFTLAALAITCSPAVAADPKKEEKKDEPTGFYTSWSKFKPGTTVTMSGGSQTDGKVTSEGTFTMKLVEVKEDGALVFQVESTTTEQGKVQKRPAEKVEVKKSDPFGGFFPQFDPKTGKPKNTVEDGTEKVKVGDSEFECKWFKVQEKLPDGSTTEAEFSVCDSVPGYLLKSSRVERQKASGTDQIIKKQMAVTSVTIKK